MKNGIPQTPRAKGDIWSALALIILVSLVARFAFGEASSPLIQSDVLRPFADAGADTLNLK